MRRGEAAHRPLTVAAPNLGLAFPATFGTNFMMLAYGWMPQIMVRPRRIEARRGQSVSINCRVSNASKITVFQGLQERRLVQETNLESFSCRLTPFRLSDDLPAGAEEHVIIRAEGQGSVVEEMVVVKLVD